MDFSANQELRDTADQVARERAQKAKTDAALAEARRLLAEQQARFWSVKAHPVLVWAGMCVGALGLIFWLSGGMA